jgi:hypothetical protein
LSGHINATLLARDASYLDNGAYRANRGACGCTMTSPIASYGVYVLPGAATQATARRQHRPRGASCGHAGAFALPKGDSLDDGGASLST